jgi:hypothetical protein
MQTGNTNNHVSQTLFVLAAAMYWWDWKFLLWIYFVQFFKIYLCLQHHYFCKFSNQECGTVTEKLSMTGVANMRARASTLFQHYSTKTHRNETNSTKNQVSQILFVLAAPMHWWGWIFLLFEIVLVLPC